MTSIQVVGRSHRVCGACSRLLRLAFFAIFLPLAGLWAQTAPIDLGAAGPKNWAVLGLGGATTVSISGQSSVRGALPEGGVLNVGVPATGSFSLTGGSSIAGKLFLNELGQAQVSGQSVITGGIVQNADALLNQAVNDALAASARFAGLPTTIANANPINIDSPAQEITITGVSGINVLRIDDLIISNGTLTLNGPAGSVFILNVSGRFELSGHSQIALTGGVSPFAVAFNLTGLGSAASISGQAMMTGILLAPSRSVEISSPVVVTGEVIAGGPFLSLSGQVQFDNPYSPPVITATASPAPNAAGWNNSNVTVTFTCTSGINIVSFCPAPITVTSEGANQIISGTVMDDVGTTATASVTLNIDKSGPVIAATVLPVPNANGWNNTPATVSFTCSDSLSGLASCTPPVTVSAEGAQVVIGIATDIAGNITSPPVTVRVDQTPPTISASATPPPNPAGWNNTSVTVTFTCSDSGSGIDGCPAPVQVTAEGANQVISGTARDKAGNTAIASKTINLDKTPPVLTITSPINGAVVPVAPLAMNGTVSDLLSGIVSVTCQGSPAAISGSTFTCTVPIVAGPNSIPVQATDVAGNIQQASVTVQGGVPTLLSAVPSSGQQGQQSLSVNITGQFTHWVQEATAASFGTGITVATLTINSATSATATLNIDPAAAVGARDITLTTGPEVVTLENGFTVNPGTPVITQVNPNSGQQGTTNVPVTITGNFTHFSDSSTVTFSGTGVNSATDLLVGSFTSSVMIRYDATTGARIGEIGGGNLAGTDGMASGPGGHLLVASFNTNQVLAYDGDSGIALGEFASGNGLVGPSGLVYGPDGNLYVGSFKSNMVLRYGGSSGDFIDVFASGGGLTSPDGIAFGPDGDLYVCSSGSNNVLRFSGTSGSFKSVFVTAGEGGLSDPTQLTFGPDGDLYVSSFFTNSVLRYDGATGAFKGVFASGNGLSGPRGVAFGPDGNLYVVSAPNNRILRYSGANGAFIDVFVSDPALNDPIYLTFITRSGPGITVGAPTVATATSLTVPVTITPAAALGTRSVTVTTGAEVLTMANGFTVNAGRPLISLVNQNTAQQGASGISVTITGNFTHFSGSSVVTFANGAVTAGTPTMATATSLTIPVSITASAALGTTNVTVTTGAEVVTLDNGFTVNAGTPIISTVNPNVGQGQQNLSVNITGQFTHLVQGTTTANFGAGITINSTTVVDPNHATANISILANAALGPRTVALTTGTEVASLPNGFTVTQAVNQPPIVSAGPNQTLSLSPVPITMTEYPIPTSASYPIGITTGPDGNLWFTESNGNKIAKMTPAGVITEFLVPYSTAITAGPDGNLWFTEQLANKIGKITTAGVITEYSIPTVGSYPSWITVGPDGNLWFTELHASQIGRITPAGVITEYSGCAGPEAIATGPDGNLWFAAAGSPQSASICNITTAGAITEFPVSPGSQPLGLAAAPDGNLWFTDSLANKIGRITPAGVITEFSIPTAASYPFTITVGPDNNLWFTEFGQQNGSKIGRITIAGVITEFLIPTTAGAPFVITEGPDCNLWFSESLGNNIGKINPLFLPATTTLTGSVTDDGLPIGAMLASAWTLTSGACHAAFGSPTATFPDVAGQTNPVVTSATLSAPGTYVVKLTGSDSQLSGSASMSITVNAKGCVVPPSGLVSWWPGDGTTNDIVSGNNGSLQNGAGFGNGQVAQSFSFAKGTAAVLVPHNANLNFADFTIESWVNLQHPLAGREDAIVTKFDNLLGRTVASHNGYQLFLEPDTHQLKLTLDNFDQHLLTVESVPVGAWTHVAATRQGNEIKFYINGVLDSSFTTTAPPTSNTDPLVIGDFYDPSLQPPYQPNQNFGGLIDEVSVYSRALSATEIQAIFDAGSAGKCKPQSETPAITSVIPNVGQQGQSNISVAITGQSTNFVQGTTAASFGTGVTVSTLTVDSATTATAVLSIDSAAVPGARTVTLTTGSEVASLVNSFSVTTVSTGPVLTQVSPNSGQQGQGGPVGVGGLNTHFVQGTTQLDFGPGIIVSNINVTCPTCLTAQLALAANAPIGPRTVTATTASEVAQLTNGFTVLAGTPILTSMVPASGHLGQSVTSTITGQFTNWVQGTTTVNLGAGITVNTVTVTNPTTLTIQLTVSANAALGLRSVTVTTGVEIVSATNVFNVLAGLPVITQANPNVGQQGQANLPVSITGQFTNFVQGTTQLNFGAGITVNSVTVVTATTLTANISITLSAAVGAQTVTATTGSEVASLANGFTVTSAGAVILSVNSNTGQQGQSGSVAITGQSTHFVQGITQVSFGTGITVNSVTVTNATTLTAQIVLTNSASVGTRTVTVSTGTEVASLANGFTVQAGTPFILTINPGSAQQGQSLPVVITTQFTHFVQGSTTVNFGAGVTVNSVTVVDATDLTAQVSIAANAPLGQNTVIVTTGSEVASVTNAFGVTAASLTPVLSIVNPNTGQDGQANLGIAITGLNTNFVQGTSQVSFGGGGVTVNSVTVTDSTHLSANISIAANAAAASHNVTVTTGTEVAAVANAFTVQPATNQAPAITIAPTWSVTLPSRLTIDYTVTDDGLPLGGALTVSWDTITTPPGATVGYQNQTPASISVGFDTAGTYTLRITATDTQYTVTQDVTVTVNPGTGGGPGPTVSIATPIDGAEVTTAVNVIGTVDSPALSNWVLEFEGPGDTTFHTLATGTTNVANGILGTFDPSALLNGIAYLRLTATDTSSQSTTFGPISLVLTRNQKIGNFTVSFNDLSVPVAGLPIQVIRTYDSRRRGNPGTDFSYGWTLDVKGAQLAESAVLGDQWNETHPSGLSPYCIIPVKAHILTATLPDGTTYQFQTTLTPQCQSFVPVLQATFGFMPIGTTPPNVSLAILGGNNPVLVNGTLGPVTFLDQDGFSTFDPDQYILTLPDGRALQISRQFGLQKMTDLNGNTLTVTAAGITHSSGKSVTFTRDVAQRITKITDPAGNSINYAYNNLTGDLTAVTDRSNNTTTFTYDTNHYLLTIKDPRGIQPIRNVYDNNGLLIQHIDAFGNTITYTHNTGTHQEIVADRLGNVTVNEYDIDGNVVKVTDALGGITQRTYDSRDNLRTETNALGNTRTYTYDANNNRLTEADPLGGTTTYVYNGRNQVTTVTDALGRVTANVYDANGNLTSTKDPVGNITTRVYNSAGLVTSVTDPNGGVTGYVYDVSGNLTRQTDALGHVTTYIYDANGNKQSETRARTTASGPETLVTSYLYDASNRLTQTTYPDGSTSQIQYNAIGKQSVTIDPLGHQTSYEYDLMGRLLKTNFPDGTSESSTYDAEGDRIMSFDRASRGTTYVYDQLKRLAQTIYPDTAVSATTYDAIGEVTAVKDPLGNTTQYVYDIAGHRTKVTDALGHSTSFMYDAVGNQSSMTDANGNLTEYQYDSDNRRTQTNYPDTTNDSVTYDALGRTVSKADQGGKTTQFQYDKLGRLTQVTDALSQLTQYTYDEVGNRLSQTDANGHTTTFAYDKQGRRTKRTLPLGMSETVAYDPAGNLKTKVDFNGKITTYNYDAANRLISKVPDVSFGAPTVGFTYTPTGQRQSMTDASGTTNYTYDLRDRLSQKVTPEGTLAYMYDFAGNLTTIRSSNAGGTSVDYSYDFLNRLSTVKDNRLASGTTTYAYDNAGNLQNYLYPNGVQTGYTYNTLNRLTNLTIAKGGTLASYGYTLGQAGNRTQVTELGGRQIDYTYDALYRLKTETISGAAVNGTIGYQYDAVGNRQQRTSTVAPVPAASYSYDTNDRLTTDTYDLGGNTTASGGSTYTYDFENHLVSQNSGAVGIVYDGDGNRVSKTTGGGTTKYLVDDRNLTGYAQVLEEISSGAVQRVYTYGLNRISQSQASGTSFYGYDGHGNVRLLTDATGAVTDRYDYDAFGNILSQAGTTPNLYLYSGEQNDPSLGFYYLRARYLNSNSGRFFTADTFPGDPESPLSLHKYLYASANPVNRRDPGGHLSLPELTAAVTIQGILGQIEITHVVFPSIAIGVALTIDRLGFEDLNEALQLASYASSSLIVLAADDLYSAGNQLIALGSRTILLAKDYTDIAKGVTSVLKATRSVADAINDVYAASGKLTLLLNDMYGLFRSFDKSARDTVTVLTNQTPVPTINNSIGATADATRAFFKVVLQIATSGNTSGLIIQP